MLNQAATKLIIDTLGNTATSFPKMYSHDWLVYAICRSYGLRWIHDNRAFIAYRQHNVNVFGAMPGFRGWAQRLKLSRSGWYRAQIIWQRQFLVQSAEEIKILEAVKNLSFFDRLYLIYLSPSLRRSGKDWVLLALVVMFRLM